MSDIAKLPALHVDDWEWHLSAGCRGMDVNTFYNPENERGMAKRRREADAKVICAGCPVRQRCLEWALTVREPHGVWGGMTPVERDELRVGLIAAVSPAALPIEIAPAA